MRPELEPFTGVILSDDGRQDEPEQLFYDLESHVPRDSSAARSTRFFDLDAIRKSLEPYYSSIRGPSIDPELMLRMLLIGYSFSAAKFRLRKTVAAGDLLRKLDLSLGADGR